MVQFFHVYKQYDRESTALSDINLRFAKGEFVFVTGASGAGKTTLLKLVFREELSTRGQILVAGRNVSMIPLNKLFRLRRNIGVVFQDFRLLKRRTILENITFALQVVGCPPRQQKQRAFAVLKMVGLQHKMQSYPLQLSGGEQQRVAIARALVNEPPLLLADEPTGNLDFDLSREIMKLFSDINNHGTTVVVASHNREIIKSMGKRTITLDRGRVYEDTNPPQAAS